MGGRHIRVDGKVRTDTKFPCGYQDVVTINRTGEHFRLIYDVKGRFHLHRIPVAEASWKLLKVKKKALGARGIPYIVTHDGRTIPYPDPGISVNEKVEKHPGAFDICHIRDAKDHKFATRKDNFFIIGSGAKPLISLPKTKGIKYTIIKDREFRLERMANPVKNQNHRKELSGGKVLDADTMELRKATREKKRLLKILKEQEAKSRKSRPKAKKSKKKKKEAE